MQTVLPEETRIKHRPLAKFPGLGLVSLGLALFHVLDLMIFNLHPYILLTRFIADGMPLDAENIFAPEGGGGFLNFNPYNLLAGLVFGTIGWGAFSYGKRLDLWQPRVIGVGLMVYPYLISNAWLLWGVGVGLLVTLWFYHHE